MLSRDVYLEHLLIFGELADHTMAREGAVALEWPTGIVGWQLMILQAILQRHKMQCVNFHGCALGLVFQDGKPMKKAWTIATTCEELRERLAVARCDGSHEHVSI